MYKRLAAFFFTVIFPLCCYPYAPMGYSGFFSACRTSMEDDNFTSGTIVVLSYEVRGKTSVLYLLDDGMLIDFAWLTHGSDYEDEYFDAQGGIRNTSVAGDVFRYLEKRPFMAVLDGEKLLSSVMKIELEECEIDYASTRAYDKSRLPSSTAHEIKNMP